MSTAILTEPRIVSVEVTDEALVAHLADGRTVSVPLAWSWRLKDAAPEQRAHWEMIGDGQGVHWPDVDEDISIEGMLRGVPAKRPSQMEMRILLDASSLIDAEHGKPLSFVELERTFREHHARLILTYTNIREFSSTAFEKAGNWFALRGQLQQVERLPVGYLREGAIKAAELREASKACDEGREYVPINPYGNRWDETLFAEGPLPTEMLVGQSLFDLVSMAFSRGDVFRQAKELWGQKLGNGYKQLRGGQQVPPPPDKVFQAEVTGEMAHSSIPLPLKGVAEFANWVYADPDRCPGFRLAHEWDQEWRKNVTQPFEWNNISDRAHVLAVPYVDFVTMDASAAHHCRNAVKRLKKVNPAINYDERIFTGLKDLLDAKF